MNQELNQAQGRDVQASQGAFFAHPLYLAFQAAWQQATGGKGQRHGGDATHFYGQKWLAIANTSGQGFLTGQAQKKVAELSERVLKGQGQVGDEAWERELLGALVYLGMAWLQGSGQAPGSPYGDPFGARVAEQQRADAQIASNELVGAQRGFAAGAALSVRHVAGLAAETDQRAWRPGVR